MSPELPDQAPAEPRPGPGTTFESVLAGAATVGARISIANVREAVRVTIGKAPPRVSVGAFVSKPPGPFFNLYRKAGDDPAEVEVAVSGNVAAGPISVPIEVSGGTQGVHYTILSPNPLVIPAGQAVGTVRIGFPAQSAWFRTRELSVTLGDVEGASVEGQAFARLVVRASAAAPVAEFGAAATSGDEGAGVMATTLDLSEAALDPVTVHLDVDDSSTASAGDYEPIPLSVVIPAGVTSQPYRVTPVDDAETEGSETLVLNIANDPRTEQVNIWSYPELLHLTEGPEIEGGPFAGYPTDNLYKDLNGQPDWSLVPVVDGVSPDRRTPAYRFGVSATSRGTSKIGKSFRASTSDQFGASCGGSLQFIPLRAENVLSLYVREPEASFRARYFGVHLYDRITMTDHRIRFEWVAGVPVVVQETDITAGGVLTGQAYDHSQDGNGWYRIYLHYTAPADVQGNGTNRFLEAFSQYESEKAVTSQGQGLIMAWPQFEQGVTTPSPYQRFSTNRWSAWGGCTAGAQDSHTFTITEA